MNSFRFFSHFKNKSIFYFIFIFSLFLIIVARRLFSDGMFTDGIEYATIARNMANGLGTFWNPHLSNYLYPEFHEHPPLALYLQSLWFRLFGDSIFVERFYSLFTFLITGIFIVFIWNELTNSIKSGWIPLLFWIAVPKNSWACANNMLENTMMVFVVLSALFYLISLRKKRILFLLLCSLSLDAAMLSKGFPALYIWSFPLWVFLFTKNISSKRMITDTIFLIAITILPIFLLFIISPEANLSLTKYFNKQVLGSIRNIQTVNTRFNILLDYLSGIIVPILIAGIILLLAKKKKIEINLSNRFVPIALALFFLSLSGVFPIMISMKQSSFYILTVYPFFSLSLSLIIYPVIKHLIFTLEKKQNFINIFTSFTYILLIFSLVFSYFQTLNIGRDKYKVQDVYKIINYTGQNINISIPPKLFATDWTLHDYLGRYGNVSTDPNKNHLHKYYVSKTVLKNSQLLNVYNEINLKTSIFHLYQKKK